MSRKLRWNTVKWNKREGDYSTFVSPKYLYSEEGRTLTINKIWNWFCHCHLKYWQLWHFICDVSLHLFVVATHVQSFYSHFFVQEFVVITNCIEISIIFVTNFDNYLSFHFHVFQNLRVTHDLEFNTFFVCNIIWQLINEKAIAFSCRQTLLLSDLTSIC